MIDPYAGIEMPTPPKGYRLAKWGECYTQFYTDANTRSKWWCPSKSKWVSFGSLGPQWYGEPAWSIFAIPKPRIRLDTPQIAPDAPS